jgi:hypothetical protein
MRGFLWGNGRADFATDFATQLSGSRGIVATGPPRSTFIPPFGPAPADVRYTDNWHTPGTQQRCLNNERIDREVEEMAAKKEWRGR